MKREKNGEGEKVTFSKERKQKIWEKGSNPTAAYECAITELPTVASMNVHA